MKLEWIKKEIDEFKEGYLCSYYKESGLTINIIDNLIKERDEIYITENKLEGLERQEIEISYEIKKALSKDRRRILDSLSIQLEKHEYEILAAYLEKDD